MVDYLAFFDDQHGNSTMGPPHARILGGAPLRFWHGATRGLNPALLPIPLPFFPLEVGPQIQLGGLGMSAVPKSNLVHFSLKNMTSGGNNFNAFPENQLTKFRAV